LKRLLHIIAVFVLAVSAGTAAVALSTLCVGDCDGTGNGSIGSLVTLVSIALGSAPLSACPYGVPSGGPVTVALLIQAVDNTLDGCPGQPIAPTVTPVAATLTPTPTVVASPGVCPTGQHRVCHSGSGRGGGYRKVCTCVVNPPPVCRTLLGTTIVAGTSVTLYDVLTVSAPDTCAAHRHLVSCGADGVLTPPNATGFPICLVVGGDD